MRKQPTTSGALALGDDEDEAVEDDGSAARKRRRVRGEIVNDVPLVKDAVGESVAESFEVFLKTFVLYNFYFV
jgi:DNA replication licensing factor MCM6